MGHRLTSQAIDSESALVALVGEPHAVTRGKVAVKLNPLTRRLIERAPFVSLATADAEGNCDVSPRGDPAGFVRILDDETLLLPERPGNRLADSLASCCAPVQGEDFDAEKYDTDRAARYARREGFY